jgi:quercetin dioxygenase-like cupin family protein
MIAERIISGQCAPIPALMPQVAIRLFASAECGASAMSTGTATFAPGERLAYHTHPCSEAVTVLEGEAVVGVEGRTYRLRRLDSIHIPAGIAHEPANGSDRAPLVVLSAFASPNPIRHWAHDQVATDDRTTGNPKPGDPEYIVRFGEAESYELAAGTEFCDLFRGRYGAVGICGGYGNFQPGTSLPCHIHDYDESITIIEGAAVCEVSGRRYQLSGCDTAFIPQQTPHRFLNLSNQPMGMIWVYAGSEPSRSIVDVEYCMGSRPWKHLEARGEGLASNAPIHE